MDWGAMVRMHWLDLRASCHGTEDPAKVAKALRACTGLDREGFDAALQQTWMDSHHGGRLLLLHVRLTRAAEIRAALGVLLADHKDRLRDELERRVDEDGVLYFRLDKQQAFLGNLDIASGDDAIQASLRVEAHPAGRDRAIVNLLKLLA